MSSVRGPADRALAQCRSLDVLASTHERERIEPGLDDRHEVQVGALAGRPTDRVRLEDLRLIDDTSELVESVKVGLTVAEVGAERDDRDASPLVTARSRPASDECALRWCRCARRSAGAARDGQFDGLHPGEADGDLGDAVSRSSNTSLFSHDGGDAVGDVAIVHGVGGLVATTRVVQIDLECEIDAEGLCGSPARAAASRRPWSR